MADPPDRTRRPAAPRSAVRRSAGARTTFGGVVLGVVAVVTLLSGCGHVLPGRALPAQVTSQDLALIHRYVDGFNAAGDSGPEAQRAFLLSTAEPGSSPPALGCLGQQTLRTEIVDRTVRADPDFMATRPNQAPTKPAGAVYVAAVSITALMDGTTVEEEIGSKHLVVRDGRVFDYAPCPK